MPQVKTEVALQFSECCAAETALQHLLVCSAEVIWTKSCAAANEKLHCNIEKAALQESGAFLPLSCGFQPPTFRHPRLGPAEFSTLCPLRFELFGPRGRESPKTHFPTLFATLGPKGPHDPRSRSREPKRTAQTLATQWGTRQSAGGGEALSQIILKKLAVGNLRKQKRYLSATRVWYHERLVSFRLPQKSLGLLTSGTKIVYIALLWGSAGLRN